MSKYMEIWKRRKIIIITIKENLERKITTYIYNEYPKDENCNKINREEIKKKSENRQKSTTIIEKKNL